ncbi:MAG: c-type cytochrome [Deltaproteobacteria bacterium]|nr:c-type cytochrome [Deltaproteobacteria bacterium]
MAQSVFAEGAKWGSKVKEALDALELKGDPENGYDIYQVCAACHLPTAWGDPAGTFPMLAGQHTSVLIKQIADIRAGNRDNPTMYPFAIQIEGAQDLADVVAYIATLPMNPDPPTGDGKLLKRGEELYKVNCVKCHKETGEGSIKDSFPLIGGQVYDYIIRQLKWIRDGKRRNANPDMVKQVNEFSDEDFIAVADYVARLKTPNHKRNLDELKTNPIYKNVKH